MKGFPSTLVFFIPFFVVVQLWGQSPEDQRQELVPNILPASPTVAAIEQYGAIPVSKHTHLLVQVFCISIYYTTI